MSFKILVQDDAHSEWRDAGPEDGLVAPNSFTLLSDAQREAEGVKKHARWKFETKVVDEV